MAKNKRGVSATILPDVCFHFSLMFSFLVACCISCWECAFCVLDSLPLQVMAISACYAGPLFNILIGISLGIFINDITSLRVELSNAILTSLVFLMVTVAITLATSIIQKLRLGRRLATLLGVLYVCYMAFIFMVDLGAF
jgi:Ca2+/Na+ antiporter